MHHSSKKIWSTLVMSCPFTGPKMFCAGPNFFEPAQKFDCTKIIFTERNSSFCLAQNVCDYHNM